MHPCAQLQHILYVLLIQQHRSDSCCFASRPSIRLEPLLIPSALCVQPRPSNVQNPCMRCNHTPTFRTYAAHADTTTSSHCKLQSPSLFVICSELSQELDTFFLRRGSPEQPAAATISTKSSRNRQHHFAASAECEAQAHVHPMVA